jgi:predicted transcriptional regulator
MREDPRVVTPQELVGVVRHELERDHAARRQRLYPVVDDDERMVGVVGWSHLADADDLDRVAEGMARSFIVAYPDEVLRTAASRMAEYEVGALPVVDSHDSSTVVGVITEFELLGGRRRLLEEERVRERPLRLRRRLASTP